MDKKLTKLMLTATSAAILFSANDLDAWQKKPIDYARCKQDGKNERRCKKENLEDNLHDFGTYLSTDAFKVFNDFSPREKQRAMEYADNDKMSPDEAVDMVSGGK